MKYLLMIVILGFSLLFTGVTVISDKCEFEEISSSEMGKSHILNEDDLNYLILYFSFSSGSYKPKLIEYIKEDDVLTVVIQGYNNKSYVTFDMAYWKATIEVDSDLVDDVSRVVVKTYKNK